MHGRDSSLVGRQGARYSIGEPLRSGAMGVVHAASGEDGRPLAAKRLIDVRNAARFEIEGRLLTRLAHPRVVEVLDFAESGDGRFLIMEWIDGPDLSRILQEHGTPGLPVEQVTAFALEACEALRYVHEQQVIHRDVKPQNLMLSPDRGIVVVDFGIARDLDPHVSGETWEIGTPGFMAPEAYVGGPFLPQTDVFGLAATVWTLLASVPPRLGQRGGPPGADAQLGATLTAALDPDPQERIPSIEEFAAQLGGTLGPERGRQLGASLPSTIANESLLSAVVRTTAGIFDAAAASLALVRPDGGLVYAASWGAGSDEILGVTLAPGTGISGNVAASRQGELIEDCRSDPRFEARVAERTGYVPHTMIAVPLLRRGQLLGVLNILDQRNGLAFDLEDLRRAELFAELAVAALGAESSAPTLG